MHQVFSNVDSKKILSVDSGWDFFAFPDYINISDRVKLILVTECFNKYISY